MVVLNTYAEVQKLTPVSSLDTLRTANGMYSLGWKTVERRFESQLEEIRRLAGSGSLTTALRQKRN